MTRTSRHDTPSVFWISAALVIAFVAGGVANPSTLGEWFQDAFSCVVEDFGWFYIFAVATFVGAASWLGFGPYAHVRLGRDDERPEFGTLTWFAMLFSAGMGIGLVFYGVAEPMLHYANPPIGEGYTVEAARQALVITYFHWGLHAWCIYAVAAASLGYFSFRRGLPLTIRSTLHPLLGDRIHGLVGHVVDILAVFATLFGLATSLGLGAKQIRAGLVDVFEVDGGTGTELLIVATVTTIATLSVVSGLHAGVRRLSEVNLACAVALLSFVVCVGPTIFLLDVLVDSLGEYVRSVIPRTFWRNAYRGEDDWHADWTLFYWGWWIAWSPFVGTFIARISRGRTLREFILAVVLVPTLFTFVWLTVFGGTALFYERHGGGIADTAVEDPSTAVFALFDRLPYADEASTLAIVVIALFFVTSSDSGSLVVDMITSGGDPDPPVLRRIFWAIAEGMIAAVLLLSGGLEALQAAAILTGLPFAVLLMLATVGLVLALRRDEAVPARPCSIRQTPADL